MGKELRQLWDGLPCKAEFGALLIAWVLLFHFLGNSTIGYVDTPSMFTWLNTVHTRKNVPITSLQRGELRTRRSPGRARLARSSV